MDPNITKPPQSLPKAEPRQILPGLSLQTPLSRRGRGPGILLLVPDVQDDAPSDVPAIGPPPLLKKWAEEGYVALEMQESVLSSRADCVELAIATIRECEQFDGTDKVGVVAVGEDIYAQAAPLIQPSDVAGVIVYSSAHHDEHSTTTSSPVPMLRHLAGGKPAGLARTFALTSYHYPAAKSCRFVLPSDAAFSHSSEGLSHTRNLSFLKPLMGGPFFDLEAIWEEHCHYEFSEDRSVENTMNTMVDEPYVNHIPTLTGGIGRSKLSEFYRDHFIFQNPEDTEIELISRTQGIDRVVDEFLFKFTHTREIDWLLPGVPPTFKRAEVPFTAIVNIRGDRLYHEHISWDQGTLLRQLGLLPDFMTFPYPVPDKTPAPGRHLELRLPVAGVEAAHKMRDCNSTPSNQMFSFGIREAC